jgi:hypothetical protein
MATTKKRTTTAKRTIAAKPASRTNGRSASNGARPYVGLSDAARKAQQKRLRNFVKELEAEGFKPDPKHVEELRRRAATWPR